jgi:enoyl-CoA hydratase/carnithine racemase
MSAEDDNTVLFDVDDNGVATFTLNRPERNNGWNPIMERRYYNLLHEADHDDRVRVGIVTGAGRSFCPGVDSGRLDQQADAARFDLTGRQSPSTPLSTRKPLIGALNGATAGMGLVQALMCDVRIAARGAKFTTAFARRGLAAEYGIAYLLPRLVGQSKALDLLLSSRVFDADEALELGVVNRVVEPGDLMDAAREYATDMAKNCSPAALAVIRHQVWTSIDQDFSTSLRDGYRSMGYLVEAPDFREGVSSYLEKRAPHFPPLSDALVPSAITGTAIDSAFAILGERGE